MRAVITVIGFAGYVRHDHDGGHHSNDNRFHTAE